MSQPKTRNLNLDLLRIFALLGAVGIHFIYPVYSRPDFLGGATWWLTNIASVLARNSIPLFIMISGYLLISKKEAYSATLSRTFLRIVVPLAAWFSLYVWWNGYYLTKPETSITILKMILQSNMYHLYFLVIMVGLYQLLPLFKHAVAKLDFMTQKKVLFFFFSIGIALYAFQYFISPYSTVINSLTIWIPYAGYFLLGGIVRKHEEYFHRRRNIFVLLFVLSALFTFVAGYIALQQLGHGNTFFWQNSGTSYFDHFLSPAVVVMASSLFALVTTTKVTLQTKPLLQKGIAEVAKTAFGIYLVHVAVLNVLDFKYGYALEFLNQGLFTYLLQRSSLAFIASFAITFITIRIPLVKLLFGEK